MKNHNEKPKRFLGANLENAEDYINHSVKDYSSEKIQELLDHNSETSNTLYASYLAKYPNSFVGEGSLRLHESRFKHVAAEHAGGERYFDSQ
jgi:hypothetical protein